MVHLVSQSQATPMKSPCSIRLDVSTSPPNGLIVQCAPVRSQEYLSSELHGNTTGSTGAGAWLVFTAQLSDVMLPQGFDDVCERDAILTQSSRPMLACAKSLFVEWHARRSTVCVRFKAFSATQSNAEIIEACAPDLIAAVHDNTVCDTTATSDEACWYVLGFILTHTVPLLCVLTVIS